MRTCLRCNCEMIEEGFRINTYLEIVNGTERQRPNCVVVEKAKPLERSEGQSRTDYFLEKLAYPVGNLPEVILPFRTAICPKCGYIEQYIDAEQFAEELERRKRE